MSYRPGGIATKSCISTIIKFTEHVTSISLLLLQNPSSGHSHVYAYPACSTISETTLPSLMTLLICSGNGFSLKSPSSPTGTEMLILLVLDVMISTVCMHSFERYTAPESVVSIWTVGTVPVICTSKDGEEVMDREETAESMTRAVFLHPTIHVLVSAFAKL